MPEKHGANNMTDDSLATDHYVVPAATVLPDTDGELIVGMFAQTNGGRGMTGVLSAGTNYIEMTKVATAANVPATWTVSNNPGGRAYQMLMATFQPASGAAPSTAPRMMLLGVGL